MKIEKVNLKKTADSISRLYDYLQVGKLNDHMLNIVKGKDGKIDFHSHVSSDEMFYVIEGRMQIEFDDGIIDLEEGDFVIVPKFKITGRSAKDLSQFF